MSVRVLPILAIAAALAAPAAAQTLVAPTILTLSDRERFGTLMVDNRSAQPQEVTISFKFGYSSSDADGNRFFIYDDTAAAAAYGLHQQIRAFPRRFVLAPGERQVVRMSARPAADAPDGVYWARIVTASQPQSPPVEQASADGVATQVVFRLEQVTTVLYQKGAVASGVDAPALEAQMEADSLAVRLPLRRLGNAPFYGRARLTVVPEEVQGDPDAVPALEDELLFEVFFDRVVRFALPLESLPSGHYRVRVSVDSDRPDIPGDERIAAEPVTLDAPFSVP
ncbi:MAG TPA: hypothetical protein VK837_09130 [Longimicrobiales bacterium]|nr:hypothetical protein [Longimicrobiales bacterium]